MNQQQTVRIPFFVESERGDDRLGTNTNTGAIISDHEATQTGIPFQGGIPQSQIQQAVEIQLKADKWVCIEKQDGSTDLLTKKDLPKLYPAQQPKHEDDWRTAFAVNPPAPKVEPAKVEPAKTTTTSPFAVKTPAPAKTCEPKKPAEPKEQWASIFEGIKSATATHKGKGG